MKLTIVERTLLRNQYVIMNHMRLTLPTGSHDLDRLWGSLQETEKVLNADTLGDSKESKS